MAENFDPYYKWLGIPPKYQPPDHYRLLGIEIFESDPEVIEVSADKQVDYLKRCATGPNVEFSQKLLNEISAARLCLLNPAKKAAYDATLKKANPAAAASAVDPQQESSSIDSGLQTSGPTQQSTTAAGFDWNSDPSRLPDVLGERWDSGQRKTSRRRDGPSPIGIIVSSLCGLAVAFAIYTWLQKKPEDKEPRDEAHVGSPSTGNSEHAPLADRKNTGSASLASAVVEKKKQEDSDSKPPEKVTPAPVAVADAKPERAAVSEPKPKESTAMPSPPPAKTPSGDALEVLPPKDPAPAVAALPLSARAAELVKLRDAATTPEAFQDVAEKGIVLVSDAIAGGDPATAKRIAAMVLAAARKTGNNELEKKATLCFLEAQKH